MHVVTADTPFFAENEVDGEAFLLLSEGQVRSMVKAIGAQNKLIARQKLLAASSSAVSIAVIIVE